MIDPVFQAPCTHVTYSRPSQVYLIVWGDYVKVGVSEQPEERLRQIRSRPRAAFAPDGVSGDPVLLRTVLGDRATERLLHLALAPYAVGHEWFRYVSVLHVIAEAFAPLPPFDPTDDIQF